MLLESLTTPLTKNANIKWFRHRSGPDNFGYIGVSNGYLRVVRVGENFNNLKIFAIGAKIKSGGAVRDRGVSSCV